MQLHFFPHLLILSILDLAEEGVPEFGAGTGAVASTVGTGERLGESRGPVFQIGARELVEALGANEFCRSALNDCSTCFYYAFPLIVFISACIDFARIIIYVFRRI